MKNPETSFLDNLSKRVEKEKFEKALYKRAQEVFSVNPPLNPNDFRGIPGYTDEEIDVDIKNVHDKERRFDEEDTPEQKEQKKFAKMLEAMLNELIELHDWLGPNAETITTSDHDDIVNGVDMVVEFQDKEKKSASHLALAVDVTFASDIGKKIDRIKEGIKNGELSRIKYFASEFLEHSGELTDIPRVIIGADVNTIKNLGALWLAEDKKALAGHEMQKVILEEVRIQLEVFAAYAQTKNQEKVAEIYEKTLQTIQDILREKNDVSISALLQDGVFRAIRREAERLEKGY
ncbi:MAG: hypothetical protein HYS73_00270 [Parcubacteria group bacterium]|nr:hypothetical protein [Parcubacteria group bacterium]MBI2049144.1 hypothetical protein [Parcubacteria group bacterium]